VQDSCMKSKHMSTYARGRSSTSPLRGLLSLPVVLRACVGASRTGLFLILFWGKSRSLKSSSSIRGKLGGSYVSFTSLLSRRFSAERDMFILSLKSQVSSTLTLLSLNTFISRATLQSSKLTALAYTSTIHGGGR